MAGGGYGGRLQLALGPPQDPTGWAKRMTMGVQGRLPNCCHGNMHSLFKD